MKVRDERFQEFYEATGYGTAAGLKGANCRHDFYPVFDGLDDLTKKETPRNPAGVSNKEYFKATQKARAYERDLRELKRERNAYYADGDKKMSQMYTKRIKETKDAYLSHVTQYGLLARPERTIALNYWSTRKTAGGIMGLKSDEVMYRKTKNTGAFKHLSEPMQLKHVKYVAEKYGIDLQGIHVKIERDESMIDSVFSGVANPNYADKGRLHLFPKAFASEEELARTLLHEKEHLNQFSRYGFEYVINNRKDFEDYTRDFENNYFLKKGWLQK